MTETDLCYLSALQLRELYQKHEVSPVEVTEADTPPHGST